MLSDGDKAECKEIAREIIEKVLTEHIKSCPHGLTLLKSKAFLVGLFIAIPCLSGGGAAMAAWIMKLLI